MRPSGFLIKAGKIKFTPINRFPAVFYDLALVVSEETGRISLAIAGELIHVSSDNFIRTFEDYMFVDETKEDK